MEITDFMSVLGTVVSAFALGLGVANYRNNIELARRSVSLAEKKILSEEFREPISQINSTVVQLLPVVEKLRGELSLSLVDLYRSVSQPSSESKYTYRPIPHHFSDLALAISDEIMVKFKSEQFVSMAQEQIRILNIVPSIDVYPFLDNNEKSDYRSFKCLENKYIMQNYGALCEVGNGGFTHFFDVESNIKTSVHALTHSLDITGLLASMRGLLVSNKTHIVKFDDDVDFVENFNVVNNLLVLLKDEYDFGVSERASERQGLDIGYAVLFACKLQLLLSASEVFLNQFEPTYT
ncbi:hypothetical protein [Vibrio metschnikovii]|uniref:hypothetical protein n=1 Tax=Vibrio metschnikovii TaxID=28172 RepID=UPI001C2FEEB5|nr:hypothetical protein [Vibrio metschnikovii]